MSEGGTSVHVGCGGCLVTIILIIVAWAFLFGVTVGGVHYGISGCDDSNGVSVDTGSAPSPASEGGAP